MASLSSLIVQRQVASIEEVEQAIARQVLHGGDLITNLLEVAPHAEPGLTRVLGESLGLPAMPPGRLPVPTDDALDRISVDLAMSAGFFPLRVAGTSLVVAVSEALSATVYHDIAYALGLEMTQVAASHLRIREGIAAHYGLPLEPRQIQLVNKLDQAQARRSSVRPPPQSLFDAMPPSKLHSGVSQPPPRSPTPAWNHSSVTDLPSLRADPQLYGIPDSAAAPSSVGSEAPATSRTGGSRATAGADSWDLPRSSDEPVRPALVASQVPAAEPASFAPAQRVADAPASGASASGAPETEAPASEAPETQVPGTDVGSQRPRVATSSYLPVSDRPPSAHAEAGLSSADVAAVARRSEPPPSDGAPPTQRVSAPPAVDLPSTEAFSDSPRPSSVVDRRAVARMLRDEVQSQQQRVMATARRKGPFSRADAERELESAKSPEMVLGIFFAFGSQFFEYCALFVLSGDLAEGRDAFGPGADHMHVQGLAVPLDLPSSLRAVRQTGGVLLHKLDVDELDRGLMRDLGRYREPLCVAALVPLTVRGRAVAVLVGDDGAHDVSIAALGDLLGFSALASTQIEHLALRKKGKRSPYAGLVAPRTHVANMAALARALDLPNNPSSKPTAFEANAQALEADAQARDADAQAPKADAQPPEFVQARDLADPQPQRSATPHFGTPNVRSPNLSPGASSVAPPAPQPSHAAPTQTYDGDALAPDAPAHLPSIDYGYRSPLGGDALGMPGSHDVDALGHTQLADAAVTTKHLPPPPSPVHAAAAMETATLPNKVTAKKAEAEPSAPLPSVQAPAVREELSEAQPEAAHSAPAPMSGRAFVRPVRREEEEDASELVAAHTDSWGAHSSEESRAGTYHLVPRPADARGQRGGDDVDRLLDRALLGGLEGEEALSDLLRLAERSLPRIVERFPGPLEVDRYKLRADIKTASECGPLLKLLVMARRSGLALVTVRSTSPDVDQRFWATHVLGELHYPESATAVLPRIFDEDGSVRRIARRAAQALVSGNTGAPLLTALGHIARSRDEAMQRRTLAIEALSDVRVPAVVPQLISVLGDEYEALGQAARTALIVVTRQDLGLMREVWNAWWDAHGEEHRIEWLIDALTHDNAGIRRAAGDELKLLTREYFGYYDDLPADDRQRAQDRYRAWWKEEGRYRFR